MEWYYSTHMDPTLSNEEMAGWKRTNKPEAMIALIRGAICRWERIKPEK